MKILLTGGSGFLGSALARHFVAAGDQVALLLRPSSGLGRLGQAAAQVRVGRCATDGDIDSFVQSVQPEVVIHTANSYGRQGERAFEIADVNVRLGLVLLEALADCGQPVTFVNSGTVLAKEVGPYALTKHQFADWGRAFAARSKGALRFVNVLLQHMYGPGDDESKFTTQVMRKCLRNEPELRLTAGGQNRDFIYIDDVVSAYATLVRQCTALPATLDVEVGSGVAPTVREFVETVRRLTASRTELLFGALPYRDNEAMHCQADLSAMRALGWAPRFDLEAGLNETLKQESST